MEDNQQHIFPSMGEGNDGYKGSQWWGFQTFDCIPPRQTFIKHIVVLTCIFEVFK